MSSGHRPTQTSNLRCLIASLVAAGNLSEARLVAQRLSQMDPAFRLTTFRALTPLQGEVRDLFANRLRVAGLPE
jgi:adenylate cyclase